MRSHRFYLLLFGTLAIMASTDSSWSQSAILGGRTSDVEGVRVVVQPRTNAPVNGKWEFNVSMDTHTKPLTADLARVSILIDDDTGRRFNAAGWQGDAAGGHHRKGVLQFPFEGPKPKSLEVQIDSIGGAAKRVFKWEIN